MKQLVEINLTTRGVKNWQPPEIRWGESLTLALRYFRTAGADEIPTYLTGTTIKAGLGREDARPDGGAFALQIGPAAPGANNITAPIPCQASAGELRDKLNAPAATAAYGAARVVAVDGSWLIFFGDQSAHVPLTVRDNTLWPISRVRLGAWQVGGKWVHELRLTQEVVAFTSNHEVTLPPAPAVTRLIEGGVSPDGQTPWNEVQQIYIPPEFSGAYILKLGFAKTKELSRDDGIEKIQDALQALGAGCFRVTLPLSDRPTIEFIGDYAGTPMPLLGREVTQAPPGDDTFTILFDKAELAALLRRESPVTVPLEIRVNGTDENGSGGEICALALPVTLRWGTIFPELESIPSLDLLRPHSHKSYVPYGEHNNLTVAPGYKTPPLGDGERDTFVIAHPLDTEAVHVFGRENISGGRQLVNGEDFRVTIDGPHQVTVTAIGAAPGIGAWVIFITGVQAVAQWANGLTVTVPQVVAGDGYPSLATFMDDLAQRVATLEEILPRVTVGVADAKTGTIEIPIPTVTEALFHRGGAVEIKDGVLPALPRKTPYMLPAIHKAEPPAALPTPLPPPSAGTLWINDADAPVLIPTGGQLGSAWVPQHGVIGSDGRTLYPMTRDGETKSYFPTAFERELFMFYISEKMLATRTMTLVFAVEAALLAATSRASWLLEIQAGAAPQDTTPAATGPNLQAVTWNPTPILRERLVLSQELVTHTFGVRIKATTSGMACDVQNYGLWSGNPAAAPAAPAFALRARLINFDTENSRTLARGWVLYRLTPAGEGAQLKAIIS